ncbi:alpha/beta fold hydrolase [Cryobacterium sp. TMT1-2-2]|uniref:alpha/beta hydrolase family protein n=1 Tax=Cryobacterium sp. TMT1-2-2 TaxID=1259233 RepID=UPI00106C119B|nr:alpha/beta fold hydrolase [Cryobacterium sp. TMT1-2-2]TFD10204.1 alpha/beta fold hydrolase [Cryobacterium sp. TMT1-2-2]
MKVIWALAGAAIAAGVGLGGLGLVIARRLTAPVSGRKFDLTIRGVDSSGERPIVILDRTPRTAAPGDYCLILENGGWVKLAPGVEDRGPSLVGREVVGELSPDVGAGQRASWSGIYFQSPADAGLKSLDIEIQTDVGPAPAWLVTPQGPPSTTWAIHIHGLGSTRAGTLRGVQVASEAGLTSLVVTYRNDGEGPRVGSGRSELGAAEVDDARAAVDYARENGARSVVLFGWSMGAAIALQLAADPRLRGSVTGLVLDSPILDWVATLKANCARAHLPAWTGALAVAWLDLRPLTRLAGLTDPVRMNTFDWIARADELTVPTLILHGTRDSSSPFCLSTNFTALRPNLIDLERFDADHTMTWNSDSAHWRAVVSSWLALDIASL